MMHILDEIIHLEILVIFVLKNTIWNNGTFILNFVNLLFFKCNSSPLKWKSFLITSIWSGKFRNHIRSVFLIDWRVTKAVWFFIFTLTNLTLFFNYLFFQFFLQSVLSKCILRNKKLSSFHNSINFFFDLRILHF